MHHVSVISVLLSFTVVSAIDTQPEYVPGVKVGGSSLLSRSSTALETCFTGKTTICSDCSTLSYCFNNEPVVNIGCTGSNPYCLPGAVEARCSDTPAFGCDTEGDQNLNPISCFALGVVPDPTNCNIYHVCRSLQTTSDIYQCPPAYHVDLTNVAPCRSNRTATCQTINCADNSNGFVYYAQSRQYYAYCAVVGQQVTPIMSKCPDRAAFDMNSKSCVYTCAGQGNFANSNVPGSYYQCYVENGRSVSVLQKCPLGTERFVETLQYCV